MTRPVSLLHTLSLASLLLLVFLLSRSSVLADAHFEGFEAEEDEFVDESHTDRDSFHLTDLPLTQSSHSTPSDTPNDVSDIADAAPDTTRVESDPSPNPPSPPTTTGSGFDYWDEEEFEGLPLHNHHQQQHPGVAEHATLGDNDNDSNHGKPDPKSTNVQTDAVPDSKKKQNYAVEIVCGSFLVVFLINYFTGRRENENIALAWAAKFVTKDSVFEKNFSVLGVGEGEDSPLLLKEGQNVFKFYASGRRYCQGLLATMELKSRHDLISRLYNMVVPCKDEISFEVYMNDDAMDHVVFALARKKMAKGLQKEVRDLQRFAVVVAQPPAGRKWVSEELGVVSESKEVAGDLITETVLEQVGFYVNSNAFGLCSLAFG